MKRKGNERMKNKLKWVAATAAALLCLTVVSVELASCIKDFLEQEAGADRIVISVVEESLGESENQEPDTGAGQEQTDGGGDWWIEISREESGEESQETEEELEESQPEIPYPRRTKKPQWQYQVQPPQEIVLLPEEEPLPVVWVVSDLHYMSSDATDYGKAFDDFVSKCDGKVVRYLPEVLDALLEEAAAEKPDTLILTGDITMDGEEINHLELAKKLGQLQEQGIQVLVIPGNHDINNHHARVYFGEEAEWTEEVSPERFGEIYGDFGYGQAFSRDQASFSYLYALRENIWLMLLDTAQYVPENLVDGAVRPETYEWMESQLEAAREQGIQVIVLGHHNLLQESRMFTTMCVMENSSDVIGLLERYQVPLYISGHLHLQRVKKHKKEPGVEEYGIYEIVSDAFSIPPCQFGVVSWQENGAIDYRTRQTDVSAWAAGNDCLDENLLDFPGYQREYIHRLIKEQIRTVTSGLEEGVAESMAWFYADTYAEYCAGLEMDPVEKERSQGYENWERFLPDSKEMKEIQAMIRDSFEDSNQFIFSAEKSSDSCS